MSARPRLALSFAFALGLVAVAPPARAQSVELVPTPAAAPAAPAAPQADAAPSAPAAGPTLQAASVGVRHQADAAATEPQRRHSSAPGMALMIVGGAAILVGLVIGGDAGAAIAVGGAVAGLVGLYQYLQ